MASDIIAHSIAGLTVGQRHKDGYVNATSLASAHRARAGERKDVADWLRLKRTKETLEHLSAVTGIPVTELYQSFHGGIPSEQGTWIHPRLSVRFGIWLSDEFGFAVESWVEKWVSGGQRPAVIALPPADIRIVGMTNALQLLGVDLDNPRYQQELKDYALNLIIGGGSGGKGQAQIAASPEPQWAGVVEIAIDIGYQSSLVNTHRSRLGKFIASFGFECKKEKRLCNGASYPINLYVDCPEIRSAISEFMDAKVLSSAD